MRTSDIAATTVLAAAFVLAGVPGCGASGSGAARPGTPADGAPKTTADELTAPEGELQFAAIRLLKNGELGLELEADGAIDVPGRGVVGHLEHDGRFLDPRDRTLVTLTPSGELVLPNGNYLPVTMDGDGTVHLLKDARVVRLKDDGSIDGANPEGPTIRVEGAASRTRRTAMFLLILASYPVLARP